MELNGWSSPQMSRFYSASVRSARARHTYDRIMDDTHNTGPQPRQRKPPRAASRNRTTQYHRAFTDSDRPSATANARTAVMARNLYYPIRLTIAADLGDLSGSYGTQREM
jgi:hypothetical protein